MKHKERKPNNLKLLRVLNNDLPQKQIAALIGISQEAYCKLEQGHNQPSKQVIAKLNTLYNMDVAALLYMPKDELRGRLATTPMPPIEANSLIQNLELEFQTLKRKMKLVSYKVKKKLVNS